MDEPKKPKSSQVQAKSVYVDEAEKILQRLSGAPEDKERISLLLQNLRKIETEHTLHIPKIQEEKFKETVIQEIESSKFWEGAEELVSAIRFSAGYVAEVNMNSESNTLESANFEIRHTGKQYRHITPVVIIEKIILNSLQVGASIKEILTSLQEKSEMFKRFNTESDNDYIQKIFVYFRNPKYQNAEGISLLIKIIGYLYNENTLLSMNDKFVKIPDKLNTRYLVPSTPSMGHSKKYVHLQEGSFIRALHKTLDYFDHKIASTKPLSDTHIKQITYAIFAMFDFLPLPKDLKNTKGTPDPTKHRYKDEKLERLYEVVARHLHFIFNAYPHFEKYRKQIFENFLHFVSDGIDEQILCEISSCKDIKELENKIGTDKKEIKKCFLNNGFALQYERNTDKFYPLLKEGVEAIFFTYNPDYLYVLYPEYENPETPMSTLNNKQINRLYLEYCEEFLYLLLFQEKNFEKLHEYSAILKFEITNFEVAFKKRLFSFIQDDVSSKTPSTDNSLKLIKVLENSENNFYLTLLSYIHKEEFAYLHNIIKSSICFVVSDQINEFEVSQKSLSDIRIKVLEMRSRGSDVRKRLHFSTSSGESNYEESTGDTENSSSHSGSSEDRKSQNRPSLGKVGVDAPSAFFNQQKSVGKKNKKALKGSSSSESSSEEIKKSTSAKKDK